MNKITQIHENFKTQLITLDGKNADKLDKSDKKLLLNFLNEPHVHPRSISALISNINSDSKVSLNLCIGYTTSKKKKQGKYSISVKYLERDLFASAITALEKISKKQKDIVCHSLFQVSDGYFVVLLTHKEA